MKNISFKDIVEKVSLESIPSLYSPYHEMDIRQFCDKMNELISYGRGEAEQSAKIQENSRDYPGGVRPEDRDFCALNPAI